MNIIPWLEDKWHNRTQFLREDVFGYRRLWLKIRRVAWGYRDPEKVEPSRSRQYCTDPHPRRMEVFDTDQTTPDALDALRIQLDI
jgi:hypothetical protein